MKWSSSLIFVSIASYVAAILCVLVLGRPLLDNLPVHLEVFGYMLMMVLLIVSLRGTHPRINLLVSFLYGFIAMFSFSGLQQWINYYGDLSLGPFMTLWDLVLAIAVLDDV